MRERIVFCAALLVSAGNLLSQSGTAETQLVGRAEREWNDAYLHGDFARLKTIMAADYMDMTDDGTFDTRAANLRSTKSGEQKFTALSVSNVTTRIYGDVAINTGVLHMELIFRDKPGGGDFLFTDVWRRRNRTWQVIASAETPTEAQQKKDEGKAKISFAADFKSAAEAYRAFRKAPAQIESAVVNAEHELSDAWIRKDKAKLESLLGEDLTDIWDDGFSKNKRQDITALLDPDDRNFESSPFGYVVRAYGDVAIHIGSEHDRGHYKGHDYDENLNELDVWRREGGGWKLIATQGVLCAKQPVLLKPGTQPSKIDPGENARRDRRVLPQIRFQTFRQPKESARIR
jgi:ketosteroid isomerase-like protein